MLDLAALFVLITDNGITWWRYEAPLANNQINDPRIKDWFLVGDMIVTENYLWRVASIEKSGTLILELFLCKTGAGRQGGVAELVEAAGH